MYSSTAIGPATARRPIVIRTASCTRSDSFERRLFHGERETDVQLAPGRAIWVSAQEHAGENIGDTDTHALFVELKD